MKRILLISIASPPKAGPESLQTAKFLKELAKNFHISLITTQVDKQGWNKPMGDKEKELIPFVSQLIELPGFNNKVFRAIKKWLPHSIKFPDDNFHFHLNPIRVLKKIDHEPQVIYSRSSPLSSSILAYKLKMKLKKPWIMHLSDPWSDNPFITKVTEKHLMWERKCFKEADYITVTNKNYQTLLQVRYPEIEHKFRLCYNVYDRDLTPLQKLDNTLIISYFGNFYGNRTPEVILTPLLLLYRNNIINPNTFKINFYGNINPEALAVIEKFNLPFVHYHGHIKQSQILELVKNTTILLNIEDDFQHLDRILFLPSKVMDYISYQRFILSISSEHSPSAAIIKDHFGQTFSPADTTGIAAFIAKAIEAHKQNNLSFFHIDAPDKRFNSQYQAENLTQLIETLIA